ncbi:hybrid-cluster NAD(P)-dependent oxidoreductase [Aestuariispira insulae]|uniref:Ferredoxin-NADP reductase n=1 Tax=Aestuariispira insulae TaxID=1461337 RepID=A0A3D9HGR0_9PROT|nr:hybrid-cluster NAD(P)-dependent oxidoreductase [Aestuariispira insulae]RED48644.1 ferredoxin-NADP reductase [Aestuariispira insulae]
MSVVKTISALNQSKPWDSHNQKLICSMVLQDSHDVKTFCFQTTDQAWFLYLPGQFITLELEIDGKVVHGTYTISSSPSRPLSITITVKATKDGYVSKWLHENMKEGMEVKAYGPAGIFTLHNHLADKYLFLAGGVGITPLMSMTRWLFDYGMHTDVSFIQSCQTPSDLLFKRELEGMSARVSDFKLSYICERPDEYGAWTGYTGRLNQLMLELICPDYMEREIFCCGPEPYMQAVRDILNSAGYDMDRYHEESFSAPVASEEEAPEHDDVIIDESNKATVSFIKSDKEVKIQESETILAAAKEAGLHIPNACQFGVCGTCKVKKVSGDVHMVHNGGINDADIEAGYILACCSNPLGPVEVEF